MPEPDQTTRFHKWLQHLLNSVAEDCASYVRQNQEGVPEDASAVHSVLLQAWDAYNIVVLLSSKYRTSKELSEFLELNALSSQDTFEQRVELLDRYFEQASEVDPDASGHEQGRGILMTQVRKVLNGTGNGQMIRDIFNQSFIEENGEWEDDFDDDEPAALVYIYQRASDARSAYNGERPPFDEAAEVRMVHWDPLGEMDKEILRDIIETQRSADGHLEPHLEEIMEKLA